MSEREERAGLRGPTESGALRHILVCLDRSTTSESALPYARALARGYGGSLRLVHVLDATAQGSGPADAFACQLERKEAERYVADIARDLASERIAVDSTVIQGEAAEQILCFADREDVDLIVLASHGEKGVTEWGLASTAEKIVARAPTSVLVVPVTASPRAGAPRLERVLVLLDGSPRAESVLPPIERLAGNGKPDVILLHVVATLELLPHEPPTAEDMQLKQRLEQRNERVARRYLSRIRDRLVRAGCNVRSIVEKGDVRTILERVACQEEVDLIALTAHGRTGNRAACHGSTAGHVVRHAARPVLMIQNLPQPRSEFAEAVRHRRTAIPLRGRARQNGS